MSRNIYYALCGSLLVVFGIWMSRGNRMADVPTADSQSGEAAEHVTELSSLEKSKALLRKKRQLEEHARNQRRQAQVAAEQPVLPLQQGGRVVYQLEVQEGGQRTVGHLDIAILKRQPRGLAARVTLMTRGKKIDTTQELSADPKATDISFRDLQHAEEPFKTLHPALQLLSELNGQKGQSIWRGHASDLAIRPSRKEKTYGGLSGTEVTYREGKTRMEGRMVRNPQMRFPVIFASEASDRHRYTLSLVRSQQLKEEP